VNDLTALLGNQAGLNPWLVVLLSSIAGLLAFALSNALYVLHSRHKHASAALRRPVAMRVRRSLAASAVAAAALALILTTPGPKLVEDRGWLSGDDLFSVSSRAGFVASYPNADRKVRKGDVILQLVRDAGPDEIAAAANRRAVLAEDLEFAKLESLRVDPLLVAAHSAEKGELDGLLERKHALLENQDSLLRGVRRQELTDQERLDQVQKDLQAARHELDQTETSFRLASTSFEVASKPDVSGLFSGDEMVKREERVAVLGSRREELRERIALLAGEQERLQALTAASDETHAVHMNQRGTEIAMLEAETALARERVKAAWQAIEQDKIRAERQREYRVRQIELQIAELDALLDAREGGLGVQAPWDGLVGFREPSPASARLGNRPLLVLYKPGSIVAKLGITADQTWLERAENVAIEMQALIPEAASSKFAGTIAPGERLPDGSGELQIVGDPPEVAIRELATGSSVPVHVVVRRQNPIAAAQMPWPLWLAVALALGCAYSEARLWWQRRPSRAAETGAATHGIDWGGNPDEFLEYVAGVGIVPRKLRRANSTGDTVEDRRGRREQAPVATQPKIKGSQS
jgi:hypothetical protein